MSVYVFYLKCNYEVNFFWHNFTVQYVNKSIENVKVLPNKNLVMFLALKTAQFLSRNGQETGMNLYCAISSRDVVLWIEFYHEGFLMQNNMSSDSELSDFSESSNDNEDIDVVYSQYTPYRIAIL